MCICTTAFLSIHFILISSLTPLQSLFFSLSHHLSGNLWNSGTNLLSTLCVCLVTFLKFSLCLGYSYSLNLSTSVYFLTIFQVIWNSGTKLLSTLCVCLVTFLKFSLCLGYSYSLNHPLQERKNDWILKIAFFNILVREPIHGYNDLNDQLFRERYNLHPIQVPLRVCKNKTANGRITKAG